MRVAYLCEFPTLLGGERSLLVFLDAARRLDVRPVVVAPQPGPLARELQARDIERIDWPPGGRRDAAALEDGLRERGTALVHANSLMTAEAAGILARKLDVPSVAHVRDIMTLSEARRKRLASLDALIAVSEAVASWLRSSGIPPETVAVIHNAVDAAELRRAACPGMFRRELDIPSDAPLVACVGQFALRKGQDLFLQTARRVAGGIPRVHFVLAGERYSRKPESARYEAELRRLASSPELAGRAHLVGYREDVPSLLSDSDLVVVPSRQEPFSRVLLEALSLGVPAVATDVGGTREIIEHGRTGVIAAPESPQEMAEAIGRLLADPALRRRMRSEGLARAEEFSPARQLEAIRALYRRIL